MFGCSIGLPIDGSGPLYGFLPFAIAGFTTAVVLGVHACLGLLSPREWVSSTTNLSQKGASR
jgi:hypothetical protein